MALRPSRRIGQGLPGTAVSELSDSSVNSKNAKTVEETYKKVSQLEHILLRPDTYIGSSQKVTQQVWVWDDSSRRMALREATFPPGLYKIFDEILVNAADHKQRDPSMSMIKVDIEPENNRISIWNNGSGIPIEIHRKEGIYVPELIFGNLLTSSNYDDAEKKVVGGRNGYGAKLANIFSTEFIVETASTASGKKFKQVFSQNMSKKGAPKIVSGNKKDDWTRITFTPDLEKFDMICLDSDVISLLKKRVYDIAGVNPSLKVYLNGEKIPIKSFKDYVNLYSQDAHESEIYYERLNERWEVAVGPSDGQLSQVSFVNSIWTIKGGTHVAHVADQIVTKVTDHLAKKNKGVKIKPFQIKSQLALYVNCLVENPSFDSQTKETLTTKPGQFGSKWTCTDDFAKKITKSTIAENILEYVRFKQSKELAKTDGEKRGRLVGITKFEDANKAGGREAMKCTLILTEGESAKALAVSGFSVVGRDYYGVFALRGKLLNVRDASHKQIMDNEEIKRLKKVLGLQHGKKYSAENVKSLRYGHVVIMADQDYDGSHIKGLVINLFDHFWPGLLKVSDFMQEFVTPIVRCIKGPHEKVFFTLTEYKTWAETVRDQISSWHPKYYKGLGTSTSEDAKHYFSNLDRHLLAFEPQNEEDTSMIDLAFSKQRVNDRKQWIASFVPGTFFDHAQDDLTYSNFVNKELVLFSIADNARSIPSVVDGLKPSQRKVLYSCFRRKLTNTEIKVLQLAGYVSEHAAYHHGDLSLHSTIIGLAQDFVGSNNLNLLFPAGQFGTRLQGGKDAASSRYIFTKLAPIARALFPAVDDPLLKYLEDDGNSVEPEWYCPVIPIVLVNGSEGIGTGWSSSVPCYNPRDLIQNIRLLLNEEQPVPMTPWYRGFKGTVVPVGNSKSFDMHGIITKTSDESTYVIKELPIRTWTTPYKEFLEANIVGNTDPGKKPLIKDILDNSTENEVRFTVTVTPEGQKELAQTGFHKKLKLSGTVTTSNMVLFDSEGRIRKYEDATEILTEFFDVRLRMYVRRREHLLDELALDLLRLDNRQRFILMVVDGKLRIAKRAKADLMSELRAKQFDEIFPKKKGNAAKKGSRSTSPEDDAAGEDDNSKDDPGENNSGYDYLLSMPLWSLTRERVARLRKQRDEKQCELDEMRKITPQALWETDLATLEKALLEADEVAAENAAELRKLSKAARQKQKGTKKGSRKGKAAISYAEDEEEDEQDEIPPPAPRSVATRKPRKLKLAAEVMGPVGGSKRRTASRQALVASGDEDELDWLEDEDLRLGSPSRNDGMAVDFAERPPLHPTAAKNSSAANPKGRGTRKVKRMEPIKIDSSSDEESSLSLSERLAQRLAISDSQEGEGSKLRANSGRNTDRGARAPKQARTRKEAPAEVEDDNESPVAQKRPRSKKQSAASDAGAIAAESYAISPSVSRVAKRTRVAKRSPLRTKTTVQSATFTDIDVTTSGTSLAHHSPVRPQRRRPQRATARKQVIEISSDSENDQDMQALDDSSEFEADSGDDDSDFE